MALWNTCPKCGILVLEPHKCSWIFRIWKWCLGYGLDYSLSPTMRIRMDWSDKKDKGITEKVHFSLVIKNDKKYLLLDEKEFVGVAEKFNGKDWYEVILEGY